MGWVGGNGGYYSNHFTVTKWEGYDLKNYPILINNEYY